MHNCPSDIELSLLAEGGLAAADAARMRRHVSSCPHCARVLLTVQELGLLEETALLPDLAEHDRKNAAARTLAPATAPASVSPSSLKRLFRWLKKNGSLPEHLPHPVPVLADAGISELCAIQCEWQVMKELGRKIPLDQLVAESTMNHWYRPGRGTPIGCLGNLMELHGLKIARIHGATIDDLRREIGMGRRVIVAVDRGEMEADTIGERLKESVEELFMQRPDHAVCVFEIIQSENGVAVQLSDSSSEDFTDPIPWGQFVAAWDDSDRLLVSAWLDESESKKENQ